MAKTQSKSGVEVPTEIKTTSKKAPASAKTATTKKASTAKTTAKKTAQASNKSKTSSEKKVYSRDQQMIISADDQYLFGNGTHYDIYKKLGAHLSVENGVKGTYFAVWAPNAEAVSVVGSFNGWEERANVMTKLGEVGIW